MECRLLGLHLLVATGQQGDTRLLPLAAKGCGSAMARGPLLLQHRLLRGYSGQLLQKQREVAPKADVKPVPGIPYNKLSVGVPKEVWKNERR
jgi:hypothetical protein